MPKNIEDCKSKNVYEALGADGTLLREYVKAIEKVIQTKESHDKALRTICDRFDIPVYLWEEVRRDLTVMKETLGPIYRERDLSVCTCGNTEMGFNCMCEWMKKHPGKNHYLCEFCGIYTASEPRCGECEKYED